ncbi:MAG: hypothetical protein JXR31_09380 [Prolixibacteraceae bacterium]|nr:hypothetical protein [Prolixibacteraceae bacterium]MBN2774445.1 hypothetical protein [Prolixibacteraceae bacterium]
MKSKGSIGLLAALLIIAGVVVTLENFGLMHGVSKHWPLLLIILGIGFSILYYNGQRQNHAIIWFATFWATIGLFFYYLVFTSWGRLATQWPVFLLIIGLSFLSLAWHCRKKIYFFSAVSFISLFLIFFLVFTISPGLWPLSMLFLGIDLLIINRWNQKQKFKNGEEL